MAWGLAIPAAIAGVSAVGQYLGRPKRRKFERTPMGRLLARRATEGLYPPTVRAGILGRVGARAGGVAQRERARIRGGLVGRGMGRSVAGERALAEPGLEQMRTVGRVAERLSIEDVMGKRQAEEQLAARGTEWGQQRRMEEGQARMGLLGGLGQVGMAAYTGAKYPEIAPHIGAGLAGIRLPYGVGRGRGLRAEEGMPDFSAMSEAERGYWALQQRDPDAANFYLIQMGWL